MKDFKKGGWKGGKSGDGSRRSSFGGKPRFGQGGGDRGRGGGGFGHGGGGFGKKEMFETTCAECGKRCEVPFRPTGERPVYCKDCFVQKERGGEGRDSGRREFSAPRNEAPSNPNRDIKRQLDYMNTKLEEILAIVKGGKASSVDKPKTKTPEKSEKPEKTKTKKKAPKKKK